MASQVQYATFAPCGEITYVTNGKGKLGNLKMFDGCESHV